MALVEQDLGRTIALAVAQHLVVFLKRPGGQAQFSAALTLQVSGDRFADLHAWIEDYLADDLSLRQLAAQAGMSERSFGRRYREATGVTPGHTIERLRVEAARHVLLETGLPLKRVATRCGFGSEETMRRAFLRSRGLGLAIIGIGSIEFRCLLLGWSPPHWHRWVYGGLICYSDLY